MLTPGEQQKKDSKMPFHHSPTGHEVAKDIPHQRGMAKRMGLSNMQVHICIDSNADEIGLVDSLAQHAGNFAIVMQNVVRPFELYRLILNHVSQNVSHDQPGDQQNLLWQKMILDRQDEGCRE